VQRSPHSPPNLERFELERVCVSTQAESPASDSSSLIDPDLAIHRSVNTKNATNTENAALRAEHGVVARAFHAAALAGARRILLVSAHSGDGKSRFADCILRHASVITDAPVGVQTLTSAWLQTEEAQLYGGGQRDPYQHGYVWIDGLALLEGEGPAVLTPALRGSLDGAILVARGMVTTRAQVADCADRLRMLGVPLLGGIWNDLDCPPVAEVLRRITTGRWTWPPRWRTRQPTRQVQRSV